MANDDRFSSSHQESIATAVAICDDDNARLVANLVATELFDSPFDDVVARCLAHRRKHDRPPGKSHLDDVFADVLEDPDHKQRQQYDNILSRMVAQSAKIDTGYVLSVVQDFTNQRKYRAGIARLVERYQKGGGALLDDIDELMRANLRLRELPKDYGFSLADSRALNFLDRDAGDYCNLGIRELDRRGVVPTRGEMLAFLSPPNRGKSMFLIHCGKMALLKGWSVVHYTLENSDDMTAQRYFQCLFNGVRHADSLHRYVVFDADDGDVQLKTETFKPDFVVDDPGKTTRFLSAKMKSWRQRLARLRIRRFPSGKMSFEMLEQDLDELRLVHKVVPDMVMVDMPQLMKMPRRARSDQDWSAMNELFTDLRGLAVERNLAVVVPQQGNRSSNAAKSVQAQHGSGSFGVFGIADNEITYSQTSSEEEHGLARLYTQKVRNDRARMTILISQHYDSGQFCMSSYPMNGRLRDLVKNFTGYKRGEDEDDDEYEGQEQEAGR